MVVLHPTPCSAAAQVMLLLASVGSAALAGAWVRQYLSIRSWHAGEPPCWWPPCSATQTPHSCSGSSATTLSESTINDCTEAVRARKEGPHEAPELALWPLGPASKR